MSDVLYPIGQIASSSVDLTTHTIKDNFEDGSQSARRLWSAQNFKRRFTIQHSALSIYNFNQLRAFFSARDGEYDSFWFRDNIHRTGNSKVRLSNSFQLARSGTNVYEPKLILDEVAPIRLLPGSDEVATSTTFSSLLYDANRFISYYDNGVIEESSIKNELPVVVALDPNTNDMILAGNTAYQMLFGVEQQYPPFYAVAGNQRYSVSATNYFPWAASAKPAFHLGMFVKSGTSSTKQVLFSIGAVGAGQTIGIQLTAANNYAPFIGGTEVWTSCIQSNGTPNTWRSVVITAASGSDTMYMYVNGVLVGSLGTNARSHLTGRVSMFADANGGSLAVNTQIGQIGLSPLGYSAGGSGSVAIAAAWHNMFAYQYGLATV